MLLAELQQAVGQVVNLGHTLSDSAHDLLSVGLHGSRAWTHVRPVGEVGLGLRIDGEHPVEVERTLSGGDAGPVWSTRLSRIT